MKSKGEGRIDGRGSLLFLHLGATALDRAGAAFGDDHLRAAFAAEIHLPELIGHESFLLFWFLLSNKFRCPLAEERPNPFGPIVGGLKQRVQIFLQTDSLIECQIHCLVHGFFAQTQGDGAFP